MGKLSGNKTTKNPSFTRLLTVYTLKMEKQRHFIHDYRTTKDTGAMDFPQWKQATRELTENMIIVKWYAFRSPLLTLGPLGPVIMQMSAISPFAVFIILSLPLLF